MLWRVELSQFEVRSALASGAVGPTVSPAVGDAGYAIRPTVSRPLGSAIGPTVRSAIGPAVRATVGDAGYTLRAAVRATVRATVGATVLDPRNAFGAAVGGTFKTRDTLAG